MNVIELYYWPTPNGQKITIFLEETGVPYTLHPVDIGNGDQFRPEFLRISPNNKMPALVDPAGLDGKPIALFIHHALSPIISSTSCVKIRDAPVMLRIPSTNDRFFAIFCNVFTNVAFSWMSASMRYTLYLLPFLDVLSCDFREALSMPSGISDSNTHLFEYLASILFADPIPVPMY